MIARINAETDIFRAAVAFKEIYPWVDRKQKWYEAPA